MDKQRDNFRMLGNTLSELQSKEMQIQNKAYLLSLTKLRTLTLLKRAQTLARIKADIPLLVKKRISLTIEGCTKQEASLLKQAFGYSLP